MKVLMVNTTYNRGGAAKIAQALYKELNRLDGWESIFAYGRGPVVEDKRIFRFTYQVEVYFHALLTRLTGIQGYGTWLSTKRLIKLIKEWKPDVIHFHNIHGYYLDLSITKLIDKLNIPTIWTLHDAWPLTGRCAYFLDCEKWRKGCGRCPYPQEYPKTYFDSSGWMWSRKRNLLGKSWKPAIVTPSSWLADLVIISCEGRCPVKIIPNGVDITTFRPIDRIQARKDLGLYPKQKIILFAASNLLEKYKGIFYFLESLKYVQATDLIVLTIGGKIDPKYIPQGVKLFQLGYVNKAEIMAKAYNAADLYCITSLADNFPTTVLEAMACATPVVGFATGGIPEQISKNCGRLVPSGDIKSLGKVITELLNDDKLRVKMGYNCRKRVEQKYNIQLFVKRYTNLYLELVDRKDSNH